MKRKSSSCRYNPVAGPQGLLPQAARGDGKARKTMRLIFAAGRERVIFDFIGAGYRIRRPAVSGPVAHSLF